MQYLATIGYIRLVWGFADATDLKSVGGDTVRVRPPLAPYRWEISNLIPL